MARHLIVISEDALVFEDLETWKRLPALASVWDQTARVERVRSVYPSVTYPAHTTMRTSVYPARHGVINNELTNLTELHSDWVWYNDAVRVPDLFDVAKEAGLTTAAVFWPVTGNHASVDYLIDEIWPHRPDQTTQDAFLESGTSADVMARIVEPNLNRLVHRTHPYCDDFINACACDIIRTYKPNLLMIHPANVDAYRHQTGVFSERVTHGLHEIDGWLADLMRAVNDAGIAEETNIFIVSDHGQMDIVRVMCPNTLLREAGLISVDSHGEVIDYQAICKSTGLSTQVYLKDPNDEALYARVHALLCRLCEEGIYGIGRVYTAQEALQEEGLGGDFSFVLETDGYTSFSNAWDRPLVRPLERSDYRFGRATHGHQPDKGAQPPLLAFGPDIQPGVVLDRRLLVDEAVTFAAALGLEMPGTDGTVIRELFREGQCRG